MDPAPRETIYPATPEGCSIIDYKQPSSSPYERPFATLQIGRKEYTVPECYLSNYRKFTTISGDSSYEFRRSIQVYHAALTYEILGLEVLAKKYIEILGRSVSIYDILDTTSTIFSKLPGDDIWLRSYLNTQLQRAFSLDERVFHRDRFHQTLGNDRLFNQAVIKMIFSIYDDTISSLRSPRNLERQKENIANRPAEERSTAMHPIEDKQPTKQQQFTNGISVGSGEEYIEQYSTQGQEQCEVKERDKDDDKKEDKSNHGWQDNENWDTKDKGDNENYDKKEEMKESWWNNGNYDEKKQEESKDTWQDDCNKDTKADENESWWSNNNYSQMTNKKTSKKASKKSSKKANKTDEKTDEKTDWHDDYNYFRNDEKKI
ncbi:hypothetical protein ABOM_001436 [Aspergillus bombycis]|uniref:Uncharacterized protein n=1 Tax=Aspergillus bombycis TaxID=109264 RepID=A0A1F8ADV5_9EURO|nr:hypothetical protein ABOM_001436 [Aspergillus bombycis]OGM49841.1 hypothetical protein ABOM_001436 [Aspergillus bombycis]